MAECKAGIIKRWSQTIYRILFKILSVHLSVHACETDCRKEAAIERARHRAIGTVAITAAIEWQTEGKKIIYLLFFCTQSLSFFSFFFCSVVVLFHFGFENFLWSIELIAFNFCIGIRNMLSISTFDLYNETKIVGNVDRRSHT